MKLKLLCSMAFTSGQVLNEDDEIELSGDSALKMIRDGSAEPHGIQDLIEYYRIRGERDCAKRGEICGFDFNDLFPNYKPEIEFASMEPEEKAVSKRGRKKKDV